MQMCVVTHVQMSYYTAAKLAMQNYFVLKKRTRSLVSIEHK